MITWDDALQQCQDFTNNPTTGTLPFFKRNLNHFYKVLLADFGRPQIEKTMTAFTVAGQRGYQLPIDFLFLKSVKVLVGSQQYIPIEEESQEGWDVLTAYTRTSDTATDYFVRPRFGLAGAEVQLNPIPASAGNTITLVYEPTDKDLAQTAYTTGTITVTNNSAAVVGSGTNWTSAMVGRYFNVTDTGGAGDGYYYRVINVGNATNLTLEQDYTGPTTSALTYKICEIFGIPEDMQMIPVYATMMHFYIMNKDQENIDRFYKLFKTDFDMAKVRYGTKTRSNVTHGKPNRNAWGQHNYPYWFPSNGAT